MPTLIVPNDYFASHEPDPAFRHDVDASHQYGWNIVFLSQESMDYDAIRIIGTIPEGDTVMYRGWMMPFGLYRRLEKTVTDAGGHMLTSYEEYVKAHYLTGWLYFFTDLTFRTILVEKTVTADVVDPNRKLVQNTLLAVGAMEQFGHDRVFLKEFVKSTDMLPGPVPTDDLAAVETMVEEFLKEPDMFVHGIAVREWVDLPENRVEIRGWWRDGQWRAFTPHPKTPGVPAPIPAEVQSDISVRLTRAGLKFVTVDFVEDVNGKLWVVEIGDGQVSGFPDRTPTETIQKVLYESRF